MSFKKLLLISTLSLACFSHGAFAAINPSLLGNYKCHGYDPFGKSNFDNSLSISQNGETISFQWLNSKGYPFILGTGIMGNTPNVISVVFWDPKKSEYFGTELFTIKQDGSLASNWTVQSENQVGTESCVKSAVPVAAPKV